MIFLTLKFSNGAISGSSPRSSWRTICWSILSNSCHCWKFPPFLLSVWKKDQPMRTSNSTPKCTDLPTNWHSFPPIFHHGPVCNELQNTKTNSEQLLADYWQTPGILEQHITGTGKFVPDSHIQAMQPFWQVSYNLHFKCLQKGFLCDN